MGVNQVQGTELYRGELEGKIGITPIWFTQFPYATTATTFSATNGVTDYDRDEARFADRSQQCRCMGKK